MKLKIIIFSRKDTGLSSACFETDFHPIKNTKLLLFLLEYCKPLLRANNSEDHFNICEELFNCSKGSCKVDDLSIIPIEQKGYDNICLIDVTTSSYCWIKDVKFIDYLSIYSTQEWLELHYPLEQFFNDEASNLDDNSKEIKSLIEKSNEYGNICGSDVNNILEFL